MTVLQDMAMRVDEARLRCDGGEVSMRRRAKKEKEMRVWRGKDER